ncbi:NADP-dependent 3-hydroxy acid dehydrogenase YdfG [Filimonas zeae]|uniref:Oxidoreductase n=1 Tax=Filimonas zeae TaxID=1737353 RepID=A0A917MUF9_9BACT|nr:SDR family oxidoreductase [Filimonas zeae]MDR6339236.1 NADP-dependent 3-hydroxy acid dehydrogenase YdfG [Filimonas zeae]GGH64492.1 oxidoreductase [Filimonas zeae]
MKTASKVALITGASSGIGEGVARLLAANGVRVGLAARRTGKLNSILQDIIKAGGDGIVIEMDVTDPEAVKAGVEALYAKYGKMDILVNNAGIMPLSDVETLKVDEWHKMVDVNIKGTLNTTAAVLPYLMAQNSGHIFNLSSIAGRKLFTGLSVYCATKHAVAAFSDIMRMELAPKYKIRVTSLQPGAVATELYDQITDAKYRKNMDDLSRQMTFLTPEDIAQSVLYALQAPEHVNVSEIFILPTEQPW